MGVLYYQSESEADEMLFQGFKEQVYNIFTKRHFETCVSSIERC